VKDLLSCLILFIVIPVIIVKKNDKMQKYILHHLKNNCVADNLRRRVAVKISFRRKLSNKVASVNVILV
jgi:hypothetical protein